MKKIICIVLFSVVTLQTQLFGQGGRIVADFYGIFTERQNITTRFVFGDGNGNLWIWANLAPITGAAAAEGIEALAFSSPGAGWWGLGIHSAAPIDLSHFANGFLNMSVRIPSGNTETFRAGIEGLGGQQGWVTFAPGSDPGGITRNGTWQRVSIPMSTFTGAGVNLTGCQNIFMLTGATPTTGVFVDDVYLSLTAGTPVNVIEVSANEVKVSPNPALDQFVVSLAGNSQRIEVLTVTGKIVHRVDNLEGMASIVINCADWSSGLYLVRIIGVNGSVSTHRVSIQ